ncbi:MAG: hypothetical protein ACXWT1_18760 [Methylobacter sp.]
MIRASEPIHVKCRFFLLGLSIQARLSLMQEMRTHSPEGEGAQVPSGHGDAIKFPMQWCGFNPVMSVVEWKALILCV